MEEKACMICGKSADWWDQDGLYYCQDCFDRKEDLAHGKKGVSLPIDDIQALAECSLRYALGRRSYITKTISDAIMIIPPDALSKRSISVMLSDIDRYQRGREQEDWQTDDPCDFENWERLRTYLKQLLKSKGKA